MDLDNPNNGTEEILQTEENPIEELPTSEVDSSNDRTKEQFSKLLQSNKELKATVDMLLKERESTPAYQSVYEEFHTTDNKDESSDVYVDEDGNVNIQKLNNDLKLAKREAEEAKKLSQRAREEVEVREAHNKHPYLDPTNPAFDAQFYEIVKDRVLRQNFYEGKINL